MLVVAQKPLSIYRGGAAVGCTCFRMHIMSGNSSAEQLNCACTLQALHISGNPTTGEAPGTSGTAMPGATRW